MTFADLVRFGLRQSRVIAAGCLVGIGAAVLWGTVLTPREYVSSATLVIMQSPINSDLLPIMMSIQGVQRLLESDQVIYETVRQLIGDGFLEEGERTPKVGRELTSRIYTSRGEERHALAPVVELVARAKSPEAAAATSNTWASKLLDALQTLKGRSLTDTLDLVETQYERSKSIVETMDDERLGTAEELSAQLVETEKRWQREIGKTQVATEQQLVQLNTTWEQRRVAFHLESRRQIEEVVNGSGFFLDDDTGSQSGLAGGATVDRDTAMLLRRVMRLRVQLAQTPEFLTLEKTVSNDAVWQTAVLQEAELLNVESLPGLRLLDQEINATYSDLANRLSLADFDLENQLTESNRKAVRKITATMEELQRQRSAGLKQLLAEQNQALAELRDAGTRRLEEMRAERDRELSDLARRRDVRLSHLAQLGEDARTHFSRLAAKYSQTELARREQELTNVFLAARAVPPPAPRPRWLALKAMLGLFLGGMLGASLALVREIAVR